MLSVIQSFLTNFGFIPVTPPTTVGEFLIYLFGALFSLLVFVGIFNFILSVFRFFISGGGIR